MTPETKALVEQPRLDARQFLARNYGQMGAQFETLEGRLPHDLQHAIAWNFWDSWLDERNHDFPGFYRGIDREAWPRLAIHIADCLEHGQTISDPLVLKHFDRSVGASKESWFQRLLRWLHR